ncbi:S41 family peptidase [Sphingobacterium sp.]|uniref:S41 family peptidase n=1 Tax=Sphingobacterium sp. TaxID=341027 RepID=UPI002FDDA203
MSFKKIFLIFSLLLFVLPMYSQTDCNCSRALKQLIAKIESEYPGFPEKTKQNKDLYQAKKNLLTKKSLLVSNESCTQLLQEYLDFFHDEHIVLDDLSRKKNPPQTSAEKTAAVPEEEISSKSISPDIFYIKISSFAYENIAPFKELIEKNSEKIENSKALIIDVRNNGGGTDDVYQPLLPYILTNPIRIMSVEFFATHTLVNGLRDYAIKNIKQDSTNEVKRIDDDLREYRENIGKFVLYGDKKVMIDSIAINPKSPKQVIILANRNVASSAENFLFSSRQSKKVKIMGTPSMGALDYGSIREFKFGCDNYQLLLPTYRSARLPQYPIDNIGIQPDIYLDESITDWMDFAVRYINE